MHIRRSPLAAEKGGGSYESGQTYEKKRQNRNPYEQDGSPSYCHAPADQHGRWDNCRISDDEYRAGRKQLRICQSFLRSNGVSGDERKPLCAGQEHRHRQRLYPGDLRCKLAGFRKEYCCLRPGGLQLHADGESERQLDKGQGRLLLLPYPCCPRLLHCGQSADLYSYIPGSSGIHPFR